MQFVKSQFNLEKIHLKLDEFSFENHEITIEIQKFNLKLDEFQLEIRIISFEMYKYYIAIRQHTILNLYILI